MEKGNRYRSIFFAFLYLLMCLCITGCADEETTDKVLILTEEEIRQLDEVETYESGPGELAVVYESLEEMVEDATDVVYVSVTKVKEKTEKYISRIYTTAKVLKTIKGDLRENERIEIADLGGGQGKAMGGLPHLSKENHYLLFLRSGTQNDFYYICGAYQGRFVEKEGYLFQQGTDGVKLNEYTPMRTADLLPVVEALAEKAAIKTEKTDN